MRMQLPRILALAVLTVAATTFFAPPSSAQQLHANDSFDCPDEYIESGDGDYALFCGYGESPVYPFSSTYLSWSYVGPGGSYEIWSSLDDGNTSSGLGTHQFQWDLLSSGPAYMGADGNFVLYGYGFAYNAWDTNTSGNGGAFLNPQTDGNLVVYTSGVSALWSIF